jgi:formylglycine-generating enzyme required for sulfatase activity
MRYLIRFGLVLLTVALAACGTDPGSVAITFTWEGGQPPDGLWIFGRVMQVNPDSEGMGQIISEMADPQEYGPGMNLSFPDIQNQDNLAILLEARGDISLESRILYYGISDPFSLRAGESKKVEVVVAMVETPDISTLVIDEAVGPEDCSDCYTSKETVTLRFNGARATSVEVANDNDFSVCSQIFLMDSPGAKAPKLVPADEGWVIEGWSLDCELEDIADGPRNVYVRLLDELGYPSQVLSANVVLDRQPPSGGTLYSSDSGWQSKLFGTVMFTVKDASEMWVEACQGTCSEDEDVIPEGLEECDSAEGTVVPVNSWTEFQTQGCVRIKDDSVTRIRVKYRDLARNGTPWSVLELSNSDLVFSEAVGPDDCSACYVPSEIVTLEFPASDAVEVQVANDSGFSVCKTTLTPGGTGEGPTLYADADVWKIANWNLDCELDETTDGPRGVYVRLLDAEGFPSQTLSNQVVLDREPPSGGTLYSSDSGWQSKLSGTVMFTVKDASEMWVEACKETCSEDEDVIPDGLKECTQGEGNAIPVNGWTTYQTQGCVSLADDMVTRIRVKYRDFARNETPWFVLELVYSELVIVEAVGPASCPDCYLSSENVTLEFPASDAVEVQVANDSGFSVCKTTLTPGGMNEGPTLSAGEDIWSIAKWDMDCELGETADGPRSVYVRMLDAEGFPSQTLSSQVVLDRTPPSGGTLYSSDSGWKTKLSGTVMFTVKDASEMWVEACQGACNQEQDTVSDGLLECEPGEGTVISVIGWTEFQTQGCVRLKDDSVSKIRVKYRDLARNETQWYLLELAYTKLHIEEAVGPVGCEDCYVSTNIVTLEFPASEAVSVQVANDSGFSACKQTLIPGETAEQPLLSTNDEEWRIEGWDIDCGLSETNDGPRSVYVRLINSEGYPSQTLSRQVVLDRQSPTEGILNCVDGDWLISFETTMQFGVVKADEMWIEACQPDQDFPDSCVSLEGGIQPCAPNNENYIVVGSWTSFTTQGCIRLKDENVSVIRVRYRDFAHNETGWIEYEFQSVAEIELNWVLIPGGTFEMGCSPGDNTCHISEFPVHSVNLSPFDMLATEVTEDQYLAAIGENPSCNVFTEGGSNFPVECVDWYAAKAFCEEIGGRLPTEAEWEYAARGGTTTKYYCGDENGCWLDIAWGCDNAVHKHEVGGKLPNAYGLHDMLGNVVEWTADWYNDDYYEVSPVNNPEGPPGIGVSVRVIRGSGFMPFYASYLRVSNRTPEDPKAYNEGLGFRCVRSD